VQLPLLGVLKLGYDSECMAWGPQKGRPAGLPRTPSLDGRPTWRSPCPSVCRHCDGLGCTVVIEGALFVGKGAT